MNLPIPLKILNVVCVLLFALAAFAQANDIDPEVYYHASSLDAALWLAFYALIAVLFGWALFKPFPKWLLVIAAIACVIEMLRSGPGLWENLFGDQDFTMMGHSMSGNDPRVELSREFFGALIALIGVGVLWWELRRYSRKAAQN